MRCAAWEEARVVLVMKNGVRLFHLFSDSDLQDVILVLRCFLICAVPSPTEKLYLDKTHVKCLLQLLLN